MCGQEEEDTTTVAPFVCSLCLRHSESCCLLVLQLLIVKYCFLLVVWEYYLRTAHELLDHGPRTPPQPRWWSRWPHNGGRRFHRFTSSSAHDGGRSFGTYGTWRSWCIAGHARHGHVLSSRLRAVRPLSAVVRGDQHL